jgi:hypothetical protein
MAPQLHSRVLFCFADTPGKRSEGNLFKTGVQHWLFLSPVDAAQHPLVGPSVLLDATLLTERHDTVLKQWYYDYRGDVPPQGDQS